LRALDRNIPVPTFRTLDQVVADSLDRPRLGEALMFAAIGLAAGIAGAFVFARW
jgi:hypothetical protein